MMDVHKSDAMWAFVFYLTNGVAFKVKTDNALWDKKNVRIMEVFA